MAGYRSVGELPKKEHSLFEGVEGRLAEELVGQAGFSGPSSLLYHRHSPSALLFAEALVVAREETSPNAALEPMHLRLGELAAADDPVLGRHVLLGNAEVTVCFARACGSGPLYRNAAGDELLYVQRGRGVLESVFGRLPFAAGDYLLVPASTTHRLVVDDADGVDLLILEARGHLGFPERYVGPGGHFLEGAPFSERDLRAPAEPLLEEGEEVEVIIRHRAGWARHRYAHHPFDVVGWDGSVYPLALSIADFEPVVGRFHQPPPVHQTFVGPAFVVCSFVPRPLDFDPRAVPAPYHHANTDSDEVIFYADGDFLSRAGSGIGRCSMTLHPAGFVHGPQPGAVEASLGASRTDETAVMIDTFSPLAVSPSARGCADPSYLRSWLS
ncbi:MAG TPA: homogentisate 1,2-dioxygenase [Acidimicrobiales bacterium]|nr:homogentisate 1,2-dioxygenase [Acidimicrobiales bacterium]